MDLDIFPIRARQFTVKKSFKRKRERMNAVSKKEQTMNDGNMSLTHWIAQSYKIFFYSHILNG